MYLLEILAFKPFRRQLDRGQGILDLMGDPPRHVGPGGLALGGLQFGDVVEGGDEAAWVSSGIARTVLRDLRRGRWVVQADLDLHGMNRDEARHQSATFLAECLRQGYRCVRVVHGKGLGSPGREPVLKKLVLGWLAQRQEVLAFCQAKPADGGAGALIVLLKGRR